MKPCKHGHVDGVMHRPCKSCQIEYLEKELADEKARNRTISEYVASLENRLKKKEKR